MAQWFVTAKKADFEAIAKKFHISPYLARLIRNRDIVDEEAIEKYLNGTRSDLYNPFLLKDMEKAVELLREAIADGTKIRIIGDYDIDGICSSFILLCGIRALGGNVDVAIPHRVKDGYGLNDSMMEEAASSGVQLIVTCDNGIAAAEQIAYGNQLGLRTIVTDHHEVPFVEEGEEKSYVLPPAEAIVNPKQEDCTYPFKGICGAVVAYKVVEALAEHCGKTEDFAGVLEEAIQFAAFATIGDVMELQDENRILVREGLRSMERTQNVGLRALLLATGLQGKKLSPYHIGFVLGPCLNATGRLDTASRALALLLENDETEAIKAANDLKELNDARKELTMTGVEQAFELVESTDLKKDKVLVIFLPDCHESLAGIIAGRVREKYGKPVLVLTRGDEEVKGSGRSIEAYHMYEALSRCKDMFTKFGGHKMAAGLSMREEDIDMLREKLNASCTLSEEDFEEKVHIDIALPFSYVTEEFVEELEKLEPFGMANSKPVFAQKDVVILSELLLGKNKNVGKYKIRDGYGAVYEMMYFGDVAKFSEFYKQKESIAVTYYPSFNEYMGRKSIQLVLQNYK